ncbi:peroxisome biogenesis protein 3-2-like [Vicia villosa]|uniref:peroxisome biogenesis protein 3-2-like n=1 Tax=Vicia villosa TaxID=3911 RepID=UPI00273C36A8|nr:peroxisome biogenesis protein 3-2-like [Vicia villosa]
MFSVRDFWRRHRRKIFISVGVIGGGYCLYNLYGVHRQKLDGLERELQVQRETEERMKDQMQAHFVNIQRISDTITLPHSMHNLSCRISEELDLSHLLERLMQGKGQPNALTQSEKLDLWARLKILSFTRMALSVWATVMLSLYTKVQVNILGRHLYIDTARSFESSYLTESGDVVDGEGQQKFLGSVDFLSQHGMPALISDMEAATKEVLKGKQLTSLFNNTAFQETITQILNTFMSRGSPLFWVKYMIPEDDKLRSTTSGSNDVVPFYMTEFEQLMMEANAVLSSAEFGSVIDISLKAVVDTLAEQMGTTSVPLARALPQVAQMCPLLLEEPSKNQFIQIINKIPEVELFLTFLYANMPNAESIVQSD